MINVVVGAPGIVPKVLEKWLEELEISESIGTIETLELATSAKILWRVLVTLDDLLSLILKWKPTKLFIFSQFQLLNEYV